MPKFCCPNEHCTHFSFPEDIDTMFMAYYRDYEGSNFLLKDRKLYCPHCGVELDLVPRGSDLYNLPAISKWKNASWEEKRDILKKRSNDQSIQYNRECKERKEHFERERYKEVR